MDCLRYTYRVLQTIQMKPTFLCVWAERAVLGSAKTALKFKYEINCVCHSIRSMFRVLGMYNFDLCKNFTTFWITNLIIHKRIVDRPYFEVIKTKNLKESFTNPFLKARKSLELFLCSLQKKDQILSLDKSCQFVRYSVLHYLVAAG